LLSRFAQIFALFFAITLFFGFASAAIKVVLPVEAQVSSGEEIDFGNVAVGETFSVVLQKNSGEGFSWDNVSVNVPNGWQANYSLGDKTMIAEISVPRNALESVQVLYFSLSSSEKSAEENFKGVLTVKKNLLTVSIDNLKQDAVVGKPITYTLIASNDSIAKHSVLVASSLPNYWFEPFTIALEPKQKKELVLSLTPQAYGLRNFSFFTRSAQNDFSREFVSELRVAPTLQGKFLAPAYAFPLFSLSNFAFYLLNSLLSMPFA